MKYYINYTKEGKILGFTKGDTDLNIEVSNAKWVEGQSYNKIIIDDDNITFEKVDWRTPEEIQQGLYNQWKAERQSKVDNIEVELNGIIYQGDETSQTRLSRAVSVMEDTDTTMWVAKDNSVNELSKADLKYILREAGIKQTLIWNDGRPEGDL